MVRLRRNDLKPVTREDARFRSLRLYAVVFRRSRPYGAPRTHMNTRRRGGQGSLRAGARVNSPVPAYDLGWQVSSSPLVAAERSRTVAQALPEALESRPVSVPSVCSIARKLG